MSTATSFWYQAGLNAVGPFVTAIVGSLLIGILVQAITRVRRSGALRGSCAMP
jgi:hypothetical protein